MACSFLAVPGPHAICYAVVVERILFRYKPMSELLKPDLFHDHAQANACIIMVWAYFSFSQG